MSTKTEEQAYTDAANDRIWNTPPENKQLLKINGKWESLENGKFTELTPEELMNLGLKND